MHRKRGDKGFTSKKGDKPRRDRLSNLAAARDRRLYLLGLAGRQQ